MSFTSNPQEPTLNKLDSNHMLPITLASPSLSRSTCASSSSLLMNLSTECLLSMTAESNFHMPRKSMSQLVCYIYHARQRKDYTEPMISLASHICRAMPSRSHDGLESRPFQVA